MVKWTQKEGTLTVETGRQGALSSVGHDLLLEVGQFEITRDGDSIRGEAKADSLSVAGVVKGDGSIDRPGLSKLERMKVERSIVKDVLKAKQHPTVTFEATAQLGEDATNLSGTLHLTGSSGEVEIDVRRDDGAWRGNFVVHQPDFGIEPYRAFMGALKVAPDVKVSFELPIPSDT